MAEWAESVRNAMRKGTDKPRVKTLSIFGMDISDRTPAFQFLFLCVGIFACYLSYGYIQELLLKGRKDFTFDWFLTFVQCTLYAAFSAVDRTVRRNHERRTPLRVYSLIGFLQIVTLAMSNQSVKHLNYPTHVLFKSSKVLPVMLVNVLYLKRNHKLMDVAGAILLVVGLSLFTLGDSSVSPEWDPIGVPMVLVALTADALIGNLQEKVMRDNGTAQDEMVLWSHGVGAIYLFVVCALTGELQAGVVYCQDKPDAVFLMMCFSVAGFFGVSFVMAMVQRFGAVIAVTATSCRKAVTIIMSFVLFPKPFSWNYLIAGLIFATGVTLQTLDKNPVALKVVSGLLSKLLFWRRSRTVPPGVEYDVGSVV